MTLWSWTILFLVGRPVVRDPARGPGAEIRGVPGDLARRPPPRMIRDFRQALGEIELPEGENGCGSPGALLAAFFTGSARGLEAAR